MMLASICNDSLGPFWDWNQTWETTQPRLSPCFRQTGLVWFPCLFLLPLCLADFFWALHTPRRRILPSLNSHASIASLLLAVLASLALFLCTLIPEYLGDGQSPWTLLLSQLLYFLVATPPTTLACLSQMGKARAFQSSLLSLLLLRHRVGFVSSGFHFFSLLILLVVALLELISRIFEVVDGLSPKQLPFVLFSLYTTGIAAAFFLDFWPLRFADDDTRKKACPEQKSSFMSRVFFWWHTPVLWTGWKKTLEHEDLWHINPDETSEVTHESFRKKLDTTYRPFVEGKKFQLSDEGVLVKGPEEKEPSFVKVLLRAFGGSFLFSGCLKVLNDVLLFAEPVILNWLIAYASDTSEPVWHGGIYIVLLFASLLAKSLAIQQYYYLMTRAGLQVRSALISAVYRKAMRMTPGARKEFTVGEIVNLMSVDAGRMQDVAPVIHLIWSAPFQIAICLYLLYNTLGKAIFAGVAVFALIVPLNAVASWLYDRYQARQMEKKDERVKFLTEILNGIKLLKLYAWEPAFQQKIQDIRAEEVGYLKKTAYINGFLEFCWNSSLLMVCMASFTTYVLTSPDHSLQPAKAFVALFLFNRLQFPISIFPMCIAYCAMLAVSVRRLRAFLAGQELDDHDIQRTLSVTENPVEVRKASFCWESTEGSLKSPALRDVSLRVSKGALVAVVGKVGSGKSSLLSALCGELHKISGFVSLQGKVAYASQEAWIQNLTLRDNILFGKALNEEKYWKTVDACALRSDLELFSDGDQTEIGERGINLSGGQKQRVSLARAVYQDADVYLFDDPLSAVDVHVGKHIFSNVLSTDGILKDKARVLVSHNLTVLSRCDWIVVMREGAVHEQGTYASLLRRQDDFASLIAEFLTEAKDDEIEELDEDVLRQLSTSPTTKAALERRISRQHTTDGRAPSAGTSLTDQFLDKLTGEDSRAGSTPFGSPSAARKHEPTVGSPMKGVAIERFYWPN